MDETIRDIHDHGARLTAALDRISGALAQMPEAADTSGLATALEEERQANAQLTERIEGLKAAAEETARLEAEVAELRAALERRDGDLQRMSQVGDELRRTNRALREANEAGLADASLVDEAMRSELESLREARQSDRAEMDEILARLAPILEEAQDD